MLKYGRRIGMEFKRTDAPALTTSMRIAMNDLKLDRMLVVYPGTRRYSLAPGVDVVPAADVAVFVP